jgi:hypothetical protein
MLPQVGHFPFLRQRTHPEGMWDLTTQRGAPEMYSISKDTKVPASHCAWALLFLSFLPFLWYPLCSVLLSHFDPRRVILGCTWSRSHVLDRPGRGQCRASHCNSQQWRITHTHTHTLSFQGVVLLEKLENTVKSSRNFFLLAEPHVSSFSSQQPAGVPCPESYEASPHSRFLLP